MKGPTLSSQLSYRSRTVISGKTKMPTTQSYFCLPHSHLSWMYVHKVSLIQTHIYSFTKTERKEIYQWPSRPAARPMFPTIWNNCPLFKADLTYDAFHMHLKNVTWTSGTFYNLYLSVPMSVPGSEGAVPVLPASCTPAIFGRPLDVLWT